MSMETQIHPMLFQKKEIKFGLDTKSYQGWFHTQMMKEDHQLPPVSEASAIIPVQRNPKILEVLLEYQTKSEQDILLLREMLKAEYLVRTIKL